MLFRSSITEATTLLRGASGLIGADSILGSAAMISDMFLTGGLASLSLTAIQAGMGIIGAALGSPLVLGSLAIAGIGYGAYKAYKYLTRNKVTSLTKIRLRQYGFTDENKDQYHRVLEIVCCPFSMLPTFIYRQTMTMIPRLSSICSRSLMVS